MRRIKQRTIQADRHTAATDVSSATGADLTFDGVGVSVFCNVAGDVEVVDLSGQASVYTMVAGSMINPPLFSRIESDNSTSTSVIVGYVANIQP